MFAPSHRRASVSRVAYNRGQLGFHLMRFQWMLAAATVLALSVPLRGWDIPPDNGTLGRDGVAEILAGNAYPETTG